MVRHEVEQQWFALRVKSNFERVAATILEAKGLELYFPTVRIRRRWSDRMKEVDQALFPGYLFCRFDPQDRLGVVTTPGILNIVGVGKTPAPIPEFEITAVRRMAESGLRPCPWPFLQIGQTVAIETGPLAGTEGILVKFKDRYRIVVSISLLQRSIAAELDIESIRTVQSASTQKHIVSFNELSDLPA